MYVFWVMYKKAGDLFVFVQLLGIWDFENKLILRPESIEQCYYNTHMSVPRTIIFLKPTQSYYKYYRD